MKGQLLGLSRFGSVALGLIAAAAPSAWAGGAGDTDGDGILDSADNCPSTANPTQVDADRDGFGSACDGDFNQDGIVDRTDARLLHAAIVAQQKRAPLGQATRACGDHGVCGDDDSSDDIEAQLRARIFDLDGNGVITGHDHHVFRGLLGRAPGPLADGDDDGVPDARDPCRQSPPGSMGMIAGCSAMEVLQDPRAVLGPVHDELVATSALLDGSASLPQVQRFIDDVSLAVADAGAAARAGDPCGSSQAIDVAVALLAQAGSVLLPPPADVSPQADVSGGDAAHRAALGDISPVDEMRALLEIVRQRLIDAGHASMEAGAVMSEICDATSEPTTTTGRVREVFDAQRRIELEDGRMVAFADPIDVRGGIVAGSDVQIRGIDLQDADVFATAVFADVIGILERLPCVQLRFAPVQPFPPYGSAPYVLHDPEGYHAYGSYLLEKGMRIAAERICITLPDTRGYTRSSFEVWVTDDDGNYTTLATDLTSGSEPVALPEWLGAFSHNPVLHARPITASCTLGVGGTTSCGPSSYGTTVDYPIDVLDHRCVATYNDTELDVNDQIDSDFRSTWITSKIMLAVWDPGTTPLFESTGYMLCPSGSGWKSCYPTVSTIYENESFAVHNWDFFPVFVTSEAESDMYRGIAGVDHAAGLSWPHVSGTLNGRPWQYSCQLPYITRDVVNFCSGENAYYRLPFKEGVTGWTQHQGNLPGCCGENIAQCCDTCCNSHNFSYAYDMVTTCDKTIRAIRAGVVESVAESYTQQIADPCSDGECANTTCCPSGGNCPANMLVVKHQDGTYSKYWHVRPNSIVPQKNDIVHRGEYVAKVGTIGPSSGPHLHLEAAWNLTDGTPPYGTQLAVFEAVNSKTNKVMTCYVPPSWPAETSADYNLRSNNKAWP